MKKLAIFMLTAIMSLALAPGLIACSDKSGEGGNNGSAQPDYLRYTLSQDGSYYAVTGVRAEAGESVTVPTIRNGKPVLEIANGAFSNSSVVTVTVSSGIQSIGADAFKNCTALKSISLPESVNSIGKRAFEGCGALTAFTVPDGVSEIADGTFNNCASLAGITVHSRVISFGSNAFFGCIALDSVSYGGSVAEWCGIVTGNEYASPMYYGNKLLINGARISGEIALENISALPYGTFKNSEITAFSVSGGITELPGEIFLGCNKLATVSLPDGIKAIGEEAFYDCVALTDFDLPSSLERIGLNAFAWCTSLENVVIPASVNYIDFLAFSNCTSMQTVRFESPEGWYIGGAAAFALNDLSANASWLVSDYSTYIWTK